MIRFPRRVLGVSFALAVLLRCRGVPLVACFPICALVLAFGADLDTEPRPKR